jgi:hypothetical protein
MKNWHLITLILLATLLGWTLPPQVGAQGRGQGFRPCPYAPYLCPVKAVCQPFDGRGQVAQVVTETLEGNMHPGMAILVDTKTQGRLHVHLGPVWYLERQEFEIKPGDEVGIKGMCEKQADKTDVIAYELTRGDYVLHLRDARGRPNWEAWRKR